MSASKTFSLQRRFRSNPTCTNQIDFSPSGGPDKNEKLGCFAASLHLIFPPLRIKHVVIHPDTAPWVTPRFALLKYARLGEGPAAELNIRRTFYCLQFVPRKHVFLRYFPNDPNDFDKILHFLRLLYFTSFKPTLVPILFLCEELSMIFPYNSTSGGSHFLKFRNISPVAQWYRTCLVYRSLGFEPRHFPIF